MPLTYLTPQQYRVVDVRGHHVVSRTEVSQQQRGGGGHARSEAPGTPVPCALERTQLLLQGVGGGIAPAVNTWVC